MAVYAFGSQVTGHANQNSDLDLAVLVEGYADPVLLWKLASVQLADLVGCTVDLLDLRRASTVMQFQVLTTGKRLWAKNSEADLFEIFVLNEKLELDERRLPQIQEILKRGSVYA
jgi:predicted nucleotidyltransferase